jgi:hypothetical protein
MHSELFSIFEDFLVFSFNGDNFMPWHFDDFQPTNGYYTERG